MSMRADLPTGLFAMCRTLVVPRASFPTQMTTVQTLLAWMFDVVCAWYHCPWIIGRIQALTLRTLSFAASPTAAHDAAADNPTRDSRWILGARHFRLMFAMRKRFCDLDITDDFGQFVELVAVNKGCFVTTRQFNVLNASHAPTTRRGALLHTGVTADA